MMVYVYCGVHMLLRATSFHLLVTAGVLVMLENMTCGFAHGTDVPQGLPPYEMVHPLRVDSRGQFISSVVSYHVSRFQRRETQEAGKLAQVFYQLHYGGHSLHFNLTINPDLVAPDFVTEKRYGGLQGSKVQRPRHSLCYFLGKVSDSDSDVRGSAALSTCDGLTGHFKLAQDEFFIRPLEQAQGERAPQAHVIYKRHASQMKDEQLPPLSGGPALNSSCGFKDLSRSPERWERQRERWERRQHRRRIHERSISREKWVETLVVADPKMVEYHGSKGVVNYILAVMNIVAGLFQDASIGNAINIAVVRIILLERDEEELKISHHADHSLNSFCKWQKRLNMKGDEHPVHHDVAILLTRKDICASINKPCETLGLSHVAGMCQPHRSCSISEDTGLPVAFTVAHELGHNFGIQHDGSGNDCEPIGKRPFIMSPQLLYGTFAPSWSRCSRQYITRFLDRGWGWCLDDPPVRDELSQHNLLPGALYSAVHQCQLQYGSSSLLCDEIDNVCSTLWCTVGNTCHSKLDGAVDGTKCGEGKWCFSGECVPVGDQPEQVNGGWESWSEWSDCSRTCGAGAQRAQRDCTNPAPRYRGRYCLGERRRYKICNTNPCPPGQPSFRHIQCSNFNTMPYKGKFYQWVHVNNRVNPCELHCRPLNEYFSEKLLDAVTDGTRCYEGSESRDMCINGICKNVGCDFQIDSNAVEDRCGVCQGNGSTCETVKKTFEKSEGLGYVDIGLIPAGARDICIEEVAEAGNFLALRSSDPGKYFLNGGWTIQWNGDYKAAGTVFTYERTGHLENLTSPGPTLEPVWIQLLFQETNPGVRYEYTISRDSVSDSNGTHPVSDFSWQFGSWTECSTTCGTGVQRQVVHCVERTTGIVEDHYCDPSTRPDDNRASCNEEICPAIWWVGDWQKCSASCGASGLAKRTVLCIQSVGLEEKRALQPTSCQHLEKPEPVVPCNRNIPCPATWSTGNWSACSTTCAGGLQTREVVCSWDTGAACDATKMPSSVTSCFIQDCPTNADVFGGDWSGSGSSSKEVFNEINSIPDDNHLPTFDTGSTKSQPRGNHNQHNHIEEDFMYSNYIDKTSDNSIKSNLPIDDFYYDYNFINFHEDLSSDVDTDNEGQKILDNSGTQEPTPSATTAGTLQKEFTTNAPQTTSTILISNSEDFFSATTLSENPDENVSEDGTILLSEDHLLPISVTPPPKSITKFSQQWRDFMKKNGSTENPEDQTLTNTIPALHHSDLMKDISHSTEVNNFNPSLVSKKTGSLNEGNDPDSAEHYHEETGLVDIEVSTTPTKNSYDEVAQTSPDYRVYEEKEEEYEEEDVPGGNTGDWDNWPQSQETTASPLPSSEGSSKSFVPTTTSPVWIETTQVPQTTHWNALGLEMTTQLHLNEISTTDTHRSSHSRDTQPDDLDTSYVPSQEPLLTFVKPPSRAHFYQDPTSQPGTTSLPPTDSKRPSLTLQTTTTSGDYDDNHDIWPAITIADVLNSRPAPDASDSSETSLGIHTSSESLGEVDYNEILVPPSLRFRGTESPAELESPTSSPPSVGRGQPTTAPQGPATSLPMPTEAPEREPANTAQWRIGNWSSCSTSCGLGAVWRIVICSSGVESDCDPLSKPAPARRCYLRPCSAWRVGNWSKCSRNCGGGEKEREVQCYDMRDQRVLRPFHCQAVSSRPPSQASCNVQQCFEWFTSSWGQCSELCGGGDQQRLVICPETERCDETLMPNRIQVCNSHPCAQWVTGSWGQCSASCGGGVQRRLVKCVNTKAEEEQEAEAQCDHEPTPANTQKCNLQECDSAPAAQVCVRDRLTFRFCQTLLWLGRCHLATVRAQCCKTCTQWAHAREETTNR